MGEPFSLRRRPKPTIGVVSPFPDGRTQPGPRWYERIRGLAGLSIVVLATGVIVAMIFAVMIVALAVFVATAFN